MTRGNIQRLEVSGDLGRKNWKPKEKFFCCDVRE